MSETRLLTKFDGSLSKEPPLSGLDDLIGRIPRLVYNRITDCGVQFPGGVFYAQEGNKRRINEVDGRVDYFGFRFYWGRAERGIITRVETSSIIENGRELLKSDLESFYCLINEEEHIFQKGRLIFFKPPTIAVGSCLRNKNDKASGKIRPYWNSYWNSVMKPLFSLAVESHKVRGA